MCSQTAVTIEKILYVDRLGHNMFNIRQFCDSYFYVRFSITSCSIEDSDGDNIFEAKRFG